MTISNFPIPGDDDKNLEGNADWEEQKTFRVNFVTHFGESFCPSSCYK